MSLIASLLIVEAKVIVCNMAALFVGLINIIVSIVAQHNYNKDVNNDDIL